MIGTKKSTCLQILDSIYSYCLLCPSRVITPTATVQETRTPVTHLPREGWAPLPCHPDVVLHAALLQDCHWSYPPALNAGTPSLCSVKRQLWFWSSATTMSPKLSSEKKRYSSSGYFTLNLLIYFFCSNSYGFYTTNCILVSCWFFLPPSLSLKKIRQHQKPSLSSPGRVLSLILARDVYEYYAYCILYSHLGDWYTQPDEEELYSSVTDTSLSPSINL